MTKEQADAEARKIFREWGERSDEIREEAKRNGKWSPGLDANKHLFKKLDDEMKTKLQELSASITE